MKAGTAIYGIVGENISYTMSPAIYQTLFTRHQIDAIYNCFDLAVGTLPAFVKTVRILPLAGFNVTIPYKEEVIQYLDRKDAICSATSSANLVINRSGRLCGYNTDYAGIAASIEDRLDCNVRGKDVLMIGSGGVARTAFYYLVRKRAGGITVLHHSRKRERKFSAWAKRVADKTPYLSAMLTSTSAPSSAALCINCTPASLESLFDKSRVKGMNGVFELRYNSGQHSRPGHLMGEYMLSVQAAENFRIMTGISVSLESIMKIIEKAER